LSEITRSKRRSSSKLRKYRVHTFLLMVLAAGILAAFGPAYLWGSQLDGEVERLTKEKELLAQQGLVLQDEVRKLNTAEYVEQLARKDLGLVKPGEVPIAQGIPGKR